MDDKKAGASKPARGGGLVVRQDGRKPLFNATRQTSAAQSPESRIPALSRSKSSTLNQGADKPSGSASPATPGGSRIPRFGSGGFGSRKPMSLTEAYKLAGEEADGSSRPGPIDGSPSPAPRSWRMRPGDEAKMRNALNEDHLDTKGAASPNKDRIAMRNRVDDGIGKSRTSRWVLEEGLRDADAPLPSTENVAPGFEASPEKSYAWQVDEDFTAGDLQVSDSPRIRVNNPPFGKPRSVSPLKGTPNAKLEEIRTRELGLTPNVRDTRPRATKLDDILSREREVPLLERGFPRIGGGHTKLDDIKKLETQGLSKRAIAQAKLAEIKEFNGMTRSVSPDSPRRNWIGREAAGIPRSKSAFEPAGRQVPDTPVTIYKSRAEMIADDVRRAAAKKAEEKNKEEPKETQTAANNRGANGLSPQKRDQSRDLLRKLARAASASPAAPERQPDDDEQRTALKPEIPRASSLKRSALVDSSRRRTSNTSSNASKNTSSSDRPTVGFAGLARSRSTDSRKSKRSSMHSEQDPTDRIEAEERLFAPMDNYSERGSVRAPSPWVDDEADNDATPRPASKQDLLALPTPRAPGAYVETPVTIKKEDRERPRRRMSLDASPDVQPTAMLREAKVDLAQGSKDVETASDPGAAEEKTARPPRSRSLPRRRALANSAKLPSVRDDLRELQQQHNIDENTFDNLEEILLGKKTSEKLDQLLQEAADVAEAKAQVKAAEAKTAKIKDARVGAKVKEARVKEEPKLRVDMERLDDELAAYEELSAAVERDLMQPQPKQKHIEKHQQKLPSHDEKHKHQHAKDVHCPLCVAQPATHTVAYLHLPLPRLFYRRPHLRLTLLGLLLSVLALWYAAESAACSLYCRPRTCSGPAPCVWSFDDPASFGAALPIKLDQWTTGGRGRVLLAAMSETVGDWAADVRDGITGVRLEDVDAEGMTFAQRRRHRRRLAKRGGAKTAVSMSKEQKAKVDAWRRERLANERAKQRGYMTDDSVGGDERVW